MQNQIEINEKEIEKEIEEEKLIYENYRVFGNKSYIPIYQKDLEKLKKSNLISTPFKTKKPSNEINLIFEMLFNEILLIILSYLSPGEIILFSLTCKQAQYICSDYLLWKQIAIKFQDYFTWNHLYFDYYNHNTYPNFELRGIQFKIQEKNQNDPKQKQIQELSKTNEKIKNYFDHLNSTTIKTGAYSYKPNFISIKSERIIYIENLENPKQEIEKKGKMIFKGLRKAKQSHFLSQKLQKKYENPNYTYNYYGTRKYLLNEVFSTMNGIILIPTFMILNYYIDSKKEISFPKLFLLSEIDLLITIFWMIHSKSSYYSFQIYYNFLSLLFSGLIFLITISLKTSKIFNFIPWLIVLLPFIVLFIYFSYQLIQVIKQYSYERNISILFTFIFGFLIFVLLFTGLKLHGFIQIKYSKLIYLLLLLDFVLIAKTKKKLIVFGEFYSFLFSLIGFSSPLSLLFLYGDSIIKKLWIALIPVHIILSIFLFFSFIIFFSSGFKLIQKIIKNEN